MQFVCIGILSFAWSAHASCRGAAVEGCLARLATEGLGMLGATREIVRTCGDENPVLDFLANPAWLPRGRTRNALAANLPETSSALALMTQAFTILQRHVEEVWMNTVEYAYGCLTAGAYTPGSNIRDALHASHRDYLSSIGASLGQFNAVAAPWVSRVGDAVHIVSRHAFAARHLDFTSSVLDGLKTLEPGAAIGALHDLTVRLASANCEMLSELVAHFTLTRLPLPSTMSLTQQGFPRFEFHSGSCCRRYHVLSHLIETLGSGPVHMVEVGVNNALTSEYLLGKFSDLSFDGVDPWIDAEPIRAEAEGRIARFGSRARLLHARSEEAALQFQAQSMDLVFIDGDHSLEAVRADLRLWRPVVRPGGLLAGHDLFNPAFEGVLEALLEYAAEVHVEGADPLTVHFGPDYVWWLHM